MYFLCKNKRVIDSNEHITTAYQHVDEAKATLAHQVITPKMWEINQPPAVHSVEGFYLVHESLFDEILKDHTK
jgi:hypothetical protein